MVRDQVLISIFFIAGISGSTAVYPAASETYSSLEDFCLKAKPKSPQDCACGQATADKLLSDREQAIALNMMGQRNRPSFESVEAHDEFMDKLARVSAGCSDQAIAR